MKKLTRYTSMDELKADKDKLPAHQSESTYESELKALVTLMKMKSAETKSSRSDKTGEKSSGK